MHHPQLIGPAKRISLALQGHSRRLASDPSGRLKLLFHGPPGTGKTTLADLIARQLGTALDIESINGRNLTIDLVRDWQRGLCYSSLFGGWKVKIINEVDLAPQVAQDLMLTFLDDLPAQNAVLATSNATMATLTDRFATRFQSVEVASPGDDEITNLICKAHRIPKASARMIAAGSCGNVRDALLQAEAFSIFGDCARRPEKKTEPVVCASRSDSAKRAWQTMRNKQTVRPSDPETDLRALWTKQGVSLKRQNELIAGIAAAAAPGAWVGPFQIPA